MPYWSVAEEHLLLELVKQGSSLQDIAQQLNRSPDAINMKLKRLGMAFPVKSAVKNLHKSNFNSATTTTQKAIEPKTSPSAQEALELLWGCIERLKEPDVNAQEIRKIRLLLAAIKAYVVLATDYLLRLEQMERQMLRIMKSQLEEFKVFLERAETPQEKAVFEERIRDLEEGIKQFMEAGVRAAKRNADLRRISIGKVRATRKTP